ncbi:APH(3') family aminoglycoside O-phosphotransferase [Pseudomonas sp. GZD-222]|uniref:APH(3') family aminoglycoside O-phosphotransferase n=1 Tax=Pseudomonas sp. GZD-222 TaxID=3404805 RepID=UPI003BB4E8DB
MLLNLPQPITCFIGDALLLPDEIGESPCDVYHFSRGNERFFLKTCPPQFIPTTYSVQREAQVLQWLEGRLSVPEVVALGESGDGEFMITRAVPGESLQRRIEQKLPVLELFREALHQVQSVLIADCPFDSSATLRLRELEYLMAQGLCADDLDLQPWPNLHTPKDLLAHLQATVALEDRVFSHGDLGDSNVFVDAREQLHFIDLGRGGIADRWLDIAFVHRNLREEVSATVAAEFLAGASAFDNPAKREFFEQLDELF